MDAKITKSRLGHMLSYDWIKILAVCAAAVVVWVLLFTTLAPRATLGQTFEIYVYPYMRYYGEAVGNLDSLHEDDALSDDVLDMALTNLMEDSMGTILGAHFAAGQGDVMFVSSREYESGSTDEEGNPIMTSDLEQFVSNFLGYCVWLGGEGEYPVEGTDSNLNTHNYLQSCKNYLDKYYPDGLDGEPDRAAVESDFRARIRGDNRYKRESQIVRGLEEEFARLARLAGAYRNVLGYLEDGTLSLTEVELTVESTQDENGDGTVDSNDTRTAKGYFSFDLSNVSGIENLIATSRGTEDGSYTGQSVNMVVLNMRLQEEALRYEQITFLDYLVRESIRLHGLDS